MNQQFFDRRRSWGAGGIYGKSGAQLVVLYCRRRMSKTELLRRFALGKRLYVSTAK